MIQPPKQRSGFCFHLKYTNQIAFSQQEGGILNARSSDNNDEISVFNHQSSVFKEEKKCDIVMPDLLALP
jgi:hypothetical protein